MRKYYKTDLDFNMNIFMYSVEVTEHEFQIHNAKYNFIYKTFKFLHEI